MHILIGKNGSIKYDKTNKKVYRGHILSFTVVVGIKLTPKVSILIG